MEEYTMEFLQQLINGLALGSVYAFLALGYTMVYGIIQLINFAHGEIYMIGAFAGFYSASTLGLPLIPTLLIAMVVSALAGIIIEKIAYKPLRNSTKNYFTYYSNWSFFIFTECYENYQLDLIQNHFLT